MLSFYSVGHSQLLFIFPCQGLRGVWPLCILKILCPFLPLCNVHILQGWMCWEDSTIPTKHGTVFSWTWNSRSWAAIAGDTSRVTFTGIIHCKDKIQKVRNKYSHKRNIGVSVPISTFMRLRAIYIFPTSVSLFCWRKYVDRSWDYINRPQTHKCWNWGWGRAIPRKGIYKGDFRCSVHVVLNTQYLSLK